MKDLHKQEILKIKSMHQEEVEKLRGELGNKDKIIAELQRTIQSSKETGLLLWAKSVVHKDD